MNVAQRCRSVFSRVASWPSKAVRLYHNSERRIRWAFGGDSYYIIRVEYPTTGILAIVKTTLQHIVYAVTKGYIPVVDLQNNKCQYHQLNEIGRINIWEKFFIQPKGIGLGEIPSRCNIILSSKSFAPHEKYFIDVSIVLPDARFRLKELAKSFRQYIHPRQAVMDEMIEKCAYAFGRFAGGGVLGVLCRGTDYTMRHPHGHPIQPSAESVIAKIKAEKEALGFSKIFLATEDQSILDMFRNAFGDAIITIGQRMINLGDKQYISELEKSDYDYFEGPLTYMAAIYALSRCNYFIGGMTAGTLMAFLMSPNTGFEYEYVFNLGHYQ